ncbi:MAG: response regulator [Rhodoferax sp.]|nr:response regulator [Rhodoferax sp.]
MSAASVHIIDDDADMREGLSWLFDSRGHSAATWDSGPPFLDFAKSLAGHWGHAVVLLDIRMAPMTGLQVFEQLKGLACPWPVLFLTGNGDVGTAVSAVKNGAWDFLEKPFQDNVLVDRVAQALAAAAASGHAQQEAHRLRFALASLSPREREVLDQLILGHYNKNIADQLGITPRTVEFHRANIFHKMGVSSAIELAHKLGRLQPMGAPTDTL